MNFSVLNLSAPVYVFIEITNQCNSLCFGCLSKGKKDAVMEAGQFEKIIKKIKTHVSEIRLTGGEPTQHPQFTAIVDILEKEKMPFSIASNGCWPNSLELMNYLKKIKYFKGLSFSLHGARASSHEQFTGSMSFEATYSCIKLAKEMQIPFFINSVIGNHNKREIKSIAYLGFNLGAKAVSFSRYIGPIRHSISIYKEELKKILRQIEELRDQNLPVTMANCMPQCFYPTDFKCLAAISFCAIDPLGNVRPCNFTNFFIGNIFDESLRQIWESKQIRQWLNKVPTECKKCDLLPDCHGGCKAFLTNLGISKDPLMSFNENLPVKNITDKKILSLPEEALPVPNFTAKREKFGMILVLDGNIVPISHKAVEIIKHYNGKTSIGDIQNKFGLSAVQLTESLYKKGFIKVTL